MDIEKAKKALINAHNAGDADSAKKIANYIKNNERQGLGGQLKDRVSEIDRLRDSRQKGDITKYEQVYRGIGQTAGAITDTVGAGLGAADDMLGNIPSKTLGAGIKIAGELPTGFGGGGAPLSETVPQDVQKLTGAYGEFKEENPRAAGILEATGNIANVLASPLTKQPVKKMGESIYKSGVKKSDDALLKMVQPREVPSARKLAQKEGRLKQGVSDVIEASDIEKRAVSVIKRDNLLKGVLPKSLSRKENIIRTGARDTSKKIQSDLGRYNNVKFKDKPLKQSIVGKIEADLMDDPTMWTVAGDPKGLVKNYVQKASDIIDRNPKTLQGLMKSRIEFDNWVQSKSPSVFNPGAETANRAATRATRNAINDFIDNAVPDQAVKDRLRDAHALFNAADNMADTVGSQANTALARAIDVVEGKMPFQSEVTKAGAATGAAMAAYNFPQIAAVGGTLYVGNKALNSAQSRKLIGYLLDKGADTLDLGTKEALQDYLEQIETKDQDALRLPAKDGKVYFEGKQ